MDIKIKTLVSGKYLGMCELTKRNHLRIGALIPKITKRGVISWKLKHISIIMAFCLSSGPTCRKEREKLRHLLQNKGVRTTEFLKPNNEFLNKLESQKSELPLL